MNIEYLICTELLGFDAHISATNCGHLFHRDCLNRWLNQQFIKTCPQCRAPVNIEHLVKKLYLNEAAGQSEADKKIEELLTLSNSQKEEVASLHNEIQVLKDFTSNQFELLGSLSTRIRQDAQTMKEKDQKLQQHELELKKYKSKYKTLQKEYELVQGDAFYYCNILSFNFFYLN